MAAKPMQDNQPLASGRVKFSRIFPREQGVTIYFLYCSRERTKSPIPFVPTDYSSEPKQPKPLALCTTNAETTLQLSSCQSRNHLREIAVTFSDVYSRTHLKSALRMMVCLRKSKAKNRVLLEDSRRFILRLWRTSFYSTFLLHSGRTLSSNFL